MDMQGDAGFATRIRVRVRVKIGIGLLVLVVWRDKGVPVLPDRCTVDARCPPKSRASHLGHLARTEF
jgi:hypothetical protein